MKQIINPFSHMLATFDPKKFFGRDDERQSILPGISSTSSGSFAVAGMRTIGKTALLKYLCDPMGAREQDERLLGAYGPGRPGRLEFVYVDLFQLDGSKVLPSLCQTLVRSDALRGFASSSSVREMETDVSSPQMKAALKETLKAAQGDRMRVVICLDHLDTALQSLGTENEEFLRHLTNYSVAYVIATERTLDKFKKDRLISSPFLNLFMPLSLKLLSEEEARQLICSPLEETDAPDRFTPGEVAFLLRTAGRQPYLLTIACELLFNLRVQYPEVKELLPTDRRVQQQVKLQLEALPAVNEIFMFFWSHIEDYERPALLRIAAGETIDSDREKEALKALTQQALVDKGPQEEKYYIFSDLFRDYVLRQAYPSGRGMIEEIVNSLAPLDRKLFEYLRSRPNQVCTFEELLSDVWEDPNASKRGLEAAIHRLRTRIADVDGTDWDYIRNVRGKGYEYVPKPT